MKQKSATLIGCLSIIALLAFVACRAGAAEGTYRRTIDTYALPDVVLVNQNGKNVSLREHLKSGNPVVIDFIYGSCSALCPIQSAGYANLQRQLGDDSRNVKLVSISIDPENDTPALMNEYLKKYRSKPGWDFLTGSREDIDTVLHAFNAYVPNKMSHLPLTLIRPPLGGSWVRITGLMSSAEFMTEFKKAGSK
jgi:protein SCO1